MPTNTLNFIAFPHILSTTSLALPSVVYSAYLAGSSQLHSTPAAVFGVIPYSWHFQFPEVFTFTKLRLHLHQRHPWPFSLQWLQCHHTVSSINISPWPLNHPAFLLPKAVLQGRLLHISNVRCRLKVQPYPHWPWLLCAYPKGIYSGRFCLGNAILLLTAAEFSAPAVNHPIVQVNQRLQLYRFLVQNITKKQPWKSHCSPLELHLVFSGLPIYLSFIPQAHLPMHDTSHCGLGPPTPEIIEKMSHRHDCTSIWSMQFLNWGSLFP